MEGIENFKPGKDDPTPPDESRSRMSANHASPSSTGTARSAARQILRQKSGKASLRE